MPTLLELPVGLRRWHNDKIITPRQREGFEMSLLEDCANAYRFTATIHVGKIAEIFNSFSRFLQEEAFFILEHYPEEQLPSRPSGADERPIPVVHYSPYLPTTDLLRLVAPYLERMIHDGFVGFGLANNRRGLELFYSEEKVMTFFTDNHLRLCDFLRQHQVPHRPNLALPADFGHDHLSLLGFPRELLPKALQELSDKDLDSTNFCAELIEQLDMYQVEEGLSFFLTRKEQKQIAELVDKELADNEFSDIEFGSLLLDWSDFVTECENGFEGDLWEYRQGLKIRDTIQSVIEIAPEALAEKIGSIVSDPDKFFQKTLIDRRKRLDPPAEPKLRQERFWYQGMVRNQGIDLRRDLIRQGWFKH
ncbi:MAG: hypothetical protein BA864_10880 [Desulfuromonadales bacterium C00003093]|nr:MAG: hypothetical protein BA864_10880 [Desulfuromonadales bacterium C00003093]